MPIQGRRRNPPRNRAVANVNYERDIKPFDDFNNDPDTPAEDKFSDDDIAYHVSGQTFDVILTLRAREYFASVDWWLLADVGEQYEGHLQEIRVDPQTPDPIKTNLNRMWSGLYGGAANDMRTTLTLLTDGTLRPRQFSGVVREILEYAVSLGNGVTQRQVVEFYNLGNTLKYKQGITATDVSTARDEWQAGSDLDATKFRLDSQYNTLYGQHIAPVLQSNDPAQVTDAAMRQGLLDMEANWVDGA